MDIQKLLEQMFDHLDKPDLNRARDSMRETVDHIAHCCMTQMVPEVSDIITSMMANGLSCQHARLVELLLSRLGRGFSFDQCLDAIELPGHEHLRTTSQNRLRVVVSQARTKLQKKHIPYWIEAVWGLGYRIVPRDLSKIPSNGIGNRNSNGRPKRIWDDLEAL